MRLFFGAAIELLWANLHTHIERCSTRVPLWSGSQSHVEIAYLGLEEYVNEEAIDYLDSLGKIFIHRLLAIYQYNLSLKLV